MKIHPIHTDSHVALRPHQERPDSVSAYDSTWTERPDVQSQGSLEHVMLADGKIYVVLAVVVIIWIGVMAMLLRTDRKIDELERRLDSDRSDTEL